MARITELADQAGRDGISVLDHLVQVPGLNAVPVEAPILEGYTVLAFIAARTARVRLVTLATAPHNRDPAMLVKVVTRTGHAERRPGRPLGRSRQRPRTDRGRRGRPMG